MNQIKNILIFCMFKKKDFFIALKLFNGIFEFELLKKYIFCEEFSLNIHDLYLEMLQWKFKK
jgi:hypothetical protein